MIRYSAEHGIPRSVLLGRVVEPGDPLWLAEDLEVVLEWQRWTDVLCSGCNQPLSESLDPELEGAYEATAMVCHSCAARSAAEKKHDGPGLQVGVALLPEAQQYLLEHGGRR